MASKVRVYGKAQNRTALTRVQKRYSFMPRKKVQLQIGTVISRPKMSCSQWVMAARSQL